MDNKIEDSDIRYQNDSERIYKELQSELQKAADSVKAGRLIDSSEVEKKWLVR